MLTTRHWGATGLSAQESDNAAVGGPLLLVVLYYIGVYTHEFYGVFGGVELYQSGNAIRFLFIVSVGYSPR